MTRRRVIALPCRVRDGDLAIAEDSRGRPRRLSARSSSSISRTEGSPSALEQRGAWRNLRVDAALNSLAVGSPGRFGEADRMSWRAWSPFIAAAERSSHHSIAADRGRGSCAASTLAFSVCRCGLASGTAAAHARARCTVVASAGRRHSRRRRAAPGSARRWRAGSQELPRQFTSHTARRPRPAAGCRAGPRAQVEDGDPGRLGGAARAAGGRGPGGASRRLGPAGGATPRRRVEELVRTSA